MKSETQSGMQRPSLPYRLAAAILRQTHGWPLRERIGWRMEKMMAQHEGWQVEIELDGVLWHLNLDDLGGRLTYLDGCHEMETPFYLKLLLRPGDRIWDIGACHGFVALRMAQLLGEKGRVDAFEPVSLNRDLLAVNLGLNPRLAPRIHLHPYALSDSAGTLTMQRTSGRNPGATHVVTEHPADDKGRRQAGVNGLETVESRIADAVWEQQGKPQIAGVKIDVEGHEMYVLKGIENLVKQAPPRWFLMEVRDAYLIAAGSNKEELFAWFSRFGYMAQSVVDGKMVADPTPRDRPTVLFLHEASF